MSYRIVYSYKKAVDNTQRFALDYVNVQENAASRHSIKQHSNAVDIVTVNHGAIINWRRHDVIWLKPTAVGIPQAHRPKTNVMRA